MVLSFLEAKDMYTVHRKILREKLINMVNQELFAKHFLAIIHRYIKNVFGIYTDKLMIIC